MMTSELSLKPKKMLNLDFKIFILIYMYIYLLIVRACILVGYILGLGFLGSEADPNFR